MKHHFDRLQYEHHQFIIWARGWVTIALVFAGIAFMYGLFCFLSKDEQYRSQRFGALTAMTGQLAIAAYWVLQIHPELHLGSFAKSLLVLGAASTCIGLIVIAQKQSNRTWLWF